MSVNVRVDGDERFVELIVVSWLSKPHHLLCERLAVMWIRGKLWAVSLL
jgi:hypothetical protein